MKILYFHQHFSTPNGSTGIRSYAMAKHLLEQGHEVIIVCGSYNGGDTGIGGEFIQGRRDGYVEGIRVIEFDLGYSNSDGFIKRTLTFLRFALKSITIAMFENYDVIFATSTPLTAGIPGIFARWLRRKKFVFEVRDLWPKLPKDMGVITNPIILSLLSMLEWLCYHSAHRCIGLSPGIVSGIAKRGVPNNLIKLVPNGCDLSIFSSPTERSWRPPGVSSSDFMAIFTGTHGIANGLDILLDVAKVLEQRDRSDIKIVLIGQGKCKSSLQQRADSEAIRNVIFHDPVDKQKLAALMESADIGLQVLANIPAFYFGTSPNKFFDYISAGLPVINNYPGWISDLIEEHKCGFSVQPDNADAFADALEMAADNRYTLSVKGINAKKLADSQFNRTNLADEWVEWVTGVQ